MSTILYAVSKEKVSQEGIPPLPSICSNIENVLPVLLMANGVILCIFGLTKVASAISLGST